MIANARMYAVTPEVGALWQRLLSALGQRAAIDLEIVSHPAPQPLAELWQREHKAAVFMCGLPFARGTFAADLLAAPVPSPAAYEGRPEYWSELVVRRDSPYRSLADTYGQRIAFTVPDSQSGYAAPLNFLRTQPGPWPRYREVVAPCITPLGALQAVIGGLADVAPVDSYAFALFAQYRPDLTAQVRSVARTAPTPIPALVSSPGDYDALRAAFLSAHTDPQLAPLLGALLLERFARPERSSYETLRTAFEQSLDYWHAHALAAVVHPAFL
jgi:ABC-type phosphate/phosphonate transport system substrate-binding protein